MNQIVTADAKYQLPVSGMAPGLAILFNDALYERCKDVARLIAGGQGTTPQHLLGKSEACFSVVTNAITWKLNPFAVAMATYQTPNGKIGYEGKLVQAIIENSGAIIGGIKFELIGDWSKIQGRWKKGRSANGKDIPLADWTDKDEDGLGVVVSAKVKGEDDPRVFTMYMRECYPRNSTLWVLRPSQQICYTAVRAFGNVAVPGILLGLPFSSDVDEGEMIDVTPAAERPKRRDFTDPAKVEVQPAAAPSHDPETGEIVEAEQATVADPVAEFGPADAYEMGAEAFSAGKAIFAFPQEWVSDGRGDLVDAFKDGWRTKESEKKGGK